MPLWLLKRHEADRPLYDAAFGFVVRAETEDGARTMASGSCGDEGPAAWLDPSRSTCTELVDDGNYSVILRDFNAG